MSMKEQYILNNFFYKEFSQTERNNPKHTYIYYIDSMIFKNKEFINLIKRAKLRDTC